MLERKSFHFLAKFKHLLSRLRVGDLRRMQQVGFFLQQVYNSRNALTVFLLKEVSGIYSTMIV